MRCSKCLICLGRSETCRELSVLDEEKSSLKEKLSYIAPEVVCILILSNLLGQGHGNLNSIHISQAPLLVLYDMNRNKCLATSRARLKYNCL